MLERLREALDFKPRSLRSVEFRLRKIGIETAAIELDEIRQQSRGYIMERRIRILIADGSTVIRRLVAEALHFEPDFEVYPAIHGSDVLDQVSQVHPDLVVIDVDLPIMCGKETVRLIREAHRKLPIILLCKPLDTNGESTLSALAAGANDCVAKAIRIGHVEAAIQYIRTHLVPKIRYWTQDSTHELRSPDVVAGHIGRLWLDARPVTGASLGTAGVSLP